MKQERIKIGESPAILWGDPADGVYVYVHGRHGSKEEAAHFARRAAEKGLQTLSFDLPEHGERKGEAVPCDVWNGVRELGRIGAYAQGRWAHIRLFACSLGAYFSLLAYRDFPLEKCLFLSPILDMKRLIENMMGWFGVSETMLEERQKIDTPMGETLDWAYYCYTKAHPIDKWDAPTAILYGEKDELTEREVAERFAARFSCALTVTENGEHFFHTQAQLAVLDNWLVRCI